MANIISISVSDEFKQLAKEHHLSWSEAARVGMSILLGNKGIEGYDNRLNHERKILQLENSLMKLQRIITRLGNKE